MFMLNIYIKKNLKHKIHILEKLKNSVLSSSLNNRAHLCSGIHEMLGNEWSRPSS
jgi:hypothetical protein